MKDESVTIRLNRHEFAQLRLLVEELEMSKSDAIRLAIRELSNLRGIREGTVKPKRDAAPRTRAGA